MADGSPVNAPEELEESFLIERFHTLPRAGGLDRQYLSLHRGLEAQRIFLAFTALANVSTVSGASYTGISASDWKVIQELQKEDPELM